MKLAKFSAKLVANFRRSLEGDFRASSAGENRQKHLPPKLHRKFHHQTSLRGSGLWRALPININIFGGTVSGTNSNRPWDKWDPSPGQNGTRPWEKPAFLCWIPQENRHFVPFVPGTGGGSSLGRLSHKGRQKNVYVFSVYCLFLGRSFLLTAKSFLLTVGLSCLR